MAFAWVHLANLRGGTGPAGPPGDGGYKGTLSTGADLNSFYGLSFDGYYAVTTDTIAASLLNAPPNAKAGTFHVFKVGSTASNQLYIEYGATGRMFVSAATSTGRSRPWVDVAANMDNGIFPATTYATFDDVNVSCRHSVWSGSAATTYGAPTANTGTITTVIFGTAAWQEWRTTSASAPGPQTWVRGKGTTGWGAWYSTSIPLDPALSPTPAGNRMAPISVTRGWGGGTTTGSGFAKGLVTLPPKARRARIVVRNINPRFTVADSPAATLSTVSIGLSSGVLNSSQSGVVTVDTGASTGTSGYFSPWFDAATFAGKDVIVGLDWSSAGTVQTNIGAGWTGSGTGATSTGATGTATGYLPFHIYVEVEIPASVPVIAAWGDSISSGVAATRPVYDSWLSQLCRGLGAAAVHFTHSGDTMNGWDSVNARWKEYGPRYQAADVVICAMGSNDVFGGATLSDMQSRLGIALPSLRRFVSPNVVAATILPRDSVTGAMEDVRRAYNLWLPFADVRQVLPFSATASADDETIISGYNSDGIHLNTSGYLALAGAVPHSLVTFPVTVDNSIGRRAFVWDEANNRLQMVYGDTGARDITGDFDPSGSGGLCVLSRSGNTVSLTLSGRTLNAASGNYTVPAGFRPDTTRTIAGIFYPSVTNNRMVVSASTAATPGQVLLFGVTAGTAYSFSVSWRTADAWPSALPGAPLGTTGISA